MIAFFQLALLPDRAHLVHLADSANVPSGEVMAIAYEETGLSLLPSIRGHHCWYSYHVDSNTVVVHHERDCEVGRFQIKPSTGRARCSGINIWTYEGNTNCFIRMFSEDVKRFGVARAICRHNTGQPLKRCPYAERIAWTIRYNNEGLAPGVIIQSDGTRATR